MKISTPLVLLTIAPLQGALVTYVNLDSATGLTAGAPHVGTNDATINSTGGQFGGAAQFDGAGDFFVVDAGGGVVGTGARTVSVWVNQTTGTANLRTAVTFGANGTGTKFDVDIDNNNGGIEVGVGNGRSANSGNPVAAGWQLLTITLADSGTAGSALAYLNNGIAITGGANTRPVNTGSNRMLIGTSANINNTSGNPSAQFFNGLVDDISVWDEVLTADEIAVLYGVGTDASLGYTGDSFDSLKQIHDAAGGSTVVDGVEWSYATGLTGSAGVSSPLEIVFDGGAGTGVTGVAVPEPSAAAFSLLGLLALGRRKRP
ncbi:MAG: LamG-like jellyroll fold domain-containing protein [Verrucomicrobiaceae bacterium]